MSSSLLKNLATVAGMLLLLMAVYLYRQVPHAKTPFSKASTQAERILLEQGKQKVELQKKENWQVGSGSGGFFRADDNKVQTLLSDLDNIQIEDKISDRADRGSDYDVTAESGIHLQLFGAQGTALGEGVFGKQSPDIAHIYFRYADKPDVYLARGLIRSDLGSVDANAWRSSQLIRVPEMKIQEITMEGKGFKTELVRVSTDTWTMNGKVVDPTAVNTLVGTLAHLQCTGFVNPAQFPNLTYDTLKFARVVVKSAEAVAELRIGPQDAASKQFYPVSTGPDFGAAWISEASFHAIQLKPSAFTPKK